MSLEALNFFQDARTRASRTKSWFVDYNPETSLIVLAIPTADYFWLAENGYDPSEVPNGTNLEEDLFAEDRKYFAFRYVAFPSKSVACDLCSGTGSHVNPSIDAGGLSREDFDEDFRESYFGGAYDVTCYACKGARTSPEVDTENLSPDERSAYDSWSKLRREQEEEEEAFEAERAAEIRMGC